MKVIMDSNLCEACPMNAERCPEGFCMKYCPEALRVEEDGTLAIVIREIPSNLHTQFQSTVASCIRLTLRE